MESLSVVELRRCLRDLFALAMLPVSWHHHDPKQTAQSLADAVLRTLDVELVYVLVSDAGGPHAVLREAGGAAHDLHSLSQLFAPFIQQGRGGPRVNVLGME